MIHRSHRGSHPWRLGAPSFVHPAGWLANVQALAPFVDDVEILFFESGEDAFPQAAERIGLRRAKGEHALSYTLHTPLDASLASLDPARRAHGIARVTRALQVGAELAPERVVVHVYQGDCEGDTPPTDLRAWRARAHASLQALLETQLVTAQQLCVESLDYDFALIAPVIEALDLRIALDVGHLMRDGRDVNAALDAYWPRIRAIQWHGTDPDDRDHRALTHVGERRGRAFVQTLLARGFDQVLTLEVFRPDDWRLSYDALHAWAVPAGDAQEAIC